MTYKIRHKDLLPSNISNALGKVKLQIIALAIFAVACSTPEQNETPPDNDTVEQTKPEAENQTAHTPPIEDPKFKVHRKMHPSWDRDKDGINDCEDDGSCDHTVDYTKARED